MASVVAGHDEKLASQDNKDTKVNDNVRHGENDESSEEVEVDTDDDIDGDVDSIVGVSIGRAQTDMKSPATHPDVKIQALEASKSYFATKDDKVAINEQPSPITRPADRNAQVDGISAPSPWQSSPAKAERSSIVSSILGSASGYNRPRSSSGSSIVENIRKKLPGIPSLSLPKFFTSEEKQMAEPDSVREPASERSLPDRTASDEREQRRRSDMRPGVLRRATSDQSLYLKRSVTGLSDFDDYTAFSNVSEMVNSRMKAIKDSFQDSNLRLPRLSDLTSTDSSRRANGDNRTNPNSSGKATTRSTTAESTDVAGESGLQNSKHPTFKSALRRISGDLVIMGGYRGSVLREAEEPHRQLWVPVKVGMNLRKADLEVGLTREDELKMHEKIIADGTLSHIGPIDISRRMLKKIKKSPNTRNGTLRLHDYGYDWRLSPDLLSDRLIAFLEKLPCNQRNIPRSQRGAWLVSHSLGGLITRHAVNRRPELFAGVVYVGTPQNCVNILGPLRNGDDVLFSSRVLTAQVNFTLRTSFALLPQNGRCFINKETGEQYDVNFFDPRSWEENRLSPCIKAAIPREQPDKRSSIIPSLSEVRSQSKRSSWFGSTDNGSAGDKAKSQLEDTKHEVEEALTAAKPDKPLAPNMHDGQHKPKVATQSTLPLEAAQAYLERTLASVLEFKQNTAHRAELQDRNAYPPCSIMFAKNTPTVYGAFVNSREDVKYDDAFEDLAFAAGDGVVLASAAQLPIGYRCVRNGRVESDRGHIGLLGDLEGIGQCLHAVLDARAKGVGLGVDGQ